MCNLYRLDKSAGEVAEWFAARNDMAGANLGSEVYPGYPGAVIAGGRVRSMIWGFPLVLKSKKTGKPLKPKPVNNARTDKLDSFMWRYSFEERRCLIPLTAWAEAEGPKGAMTRTWLRLPDKPIFAAAGIWRGSEEWGECYSMVMTDAVGAASVVHSRMPVILRAGDYERWQVGTPEEARSLCVGYSGEIAVERTQDKWRRSRCPLFFGTVAFLQFPMRTCVYLPRACPGGFNGGKS